MKENDPFYNKVDKCVHQIICDSCAIKLNSGTLSQVVDYKRFKILQSRSIEQNCSCKIWIARSCLPKSAIPFKHVMNKNYVWL